MTHDPMTASVGRPATITVQQKAGQQPHRVIISVSGFQPAEDGSPVTVVVAFTTTTTSGEEREIGRFGITPQAPSGIERFALPLPREIVGSSDIKLTIALVPSCGAGKGARLRVGGAELR